MQLSDLQVRCLLLAAQSRIIVQRAWLLDAMTVVSQHDVEFHAEGDLTIGKETIVKKSSSNKPTDYEYVLGQVVQVGTFAGIVTRVDDAEDQITVAVLGDLQHPLYHRFDEIKFQPEVVRDILGVNPFTQFVGTTTVGRFIENVVILQIPFNFRIFEMQNYVWDPGKILKMVSKELIRHGTTMTVTEYKSFLDNVFYLNHITEICVPSMTERSLMTHPDVPKVKKQFIEEHKGQMNDPMVIKELEDKLIALDKEWLGDDPSMDFFKGLGSKSFDIHRKKLFLTTGGIPAFTTYSGSFDFIPNSLMEGWTKEALPSIANETRKGSYERGVETAKGGAETKLVMRVFQDLAIIADDCGTKRTIAANFGGDFQIKDFLGRTLQVDGRDVVITEDNMKEFDGKVCRLYSPLTCEQKYDLCYKCCGQRARSLNAKIIGIQAVKITSKFMNLAMKNMHGTALKLVEPTLDQILL